MRRTVGRFYHLDEFRNVVERMPPEEYLRASYYERWLHALETLMVERGVITLEELPSGRANGPAIAASIQHELLPALEARFTPRDNVVTRNLQPAAQTHLPPHARANPESLPTC